MRRLILAITFLSFFIAQNLEAQSKTIGFQKNQVKKIEGVKSTEYFPISDKQYNSLMNLKDKKEITLDNGDIVYMVTALQVKVPGIFTREQLISLREAVGPMPLEPGDVCEENGRECPQGYFCSPALKLGAKICLETEREDKQCEDVFLIQPGGKRCVPLSTR